MVAPQCDRYKIRVYNKQEHHITLEGILYRMRVGYPSRDISRAFDDWNTIYRRFNLKRCSSSMIHRIEAIT